MALYAGFHNQILPPQSGAWRFCREPSGRDLAYKKDMTDTFATQFISAARKRMYEYREEKISCKGLMVYKKGVAAKRKICRGIFFSFGCTMGPERFTKFRKRFSLVHQPIYMLNQSKLYLGRQICLPISFSLSLYELEKACFSFGCNGSWKFKYNRRTRKKILEGSWFKKSRL